MIKTNFVFQLDSKEDADIIIRSLKPELKKRISNTKIDIKISEKKILLNIEAENISSIRAACNSYLRWIKTALDVKNSI